MNCFFFTKSNWTTEWQLCQFLWPGEVCSLCISQWIKLYYLDFIHTVEFIFGIFSFGFSIWDDDVADQGHLQAEKTIKIKIFKYKKFFILKKNIHRTKSRRLSTVCVSTLKRCLHECKNRRFTTRCKPLVTVKNSVAG